MRFLSVFCIIGLACFVFQGSASAAQPPVAISQSGQLQRALVGSYGDFFPAGAQGISADAPVLALELRAPGEETTRVLVPGTENARYETNPFVFQDPTYNSLTILWSSRPEEGEAQIHFATFDGDDWSDVYILENEEAAVSVGSTPLIEESRDAFELVLDDGEILTAERSILHLLWQTNDALPETQYVPLTFVEGRYIGWHSIFTLDEMFLDDPETNEAEGDETDDGDGTSANEGSEPPTLTAALARTLGVKVAQDGRSVLVTFANSASHRLGTVEISPLPLELGFLGDQVREQIFSMVELYDPDDLSSFSAGMRAAIIPMGSIFNFHEAYGNHLADRVGDWILNFGEEYGWAGFERLGDDARSLAIDVSNEVYLSTKADPANPDAEIIEINIAGLLAGEQGPTQSLDIMVKSDQPAPAAGEGPATVLTSQNGRSLLVTWDDEETGQIHWVESRRGAPWSEPFSLTLDHSLSLEEAHDLLQQKIR